jgi:hypothetical protein
MAPYPVFTPYLPTATINESRLTPWDGMAG